MKSNQERKKKVSQPQGVELIGAIHELGKNRHASISELRKMEDAVTCINRTKAAISIDKRAGFIFEEVLAGTYNAAARAAGDFHTTATTGLRNGLGIDPRVDIRVVRAGKVIAEAQAKCCRAPKRTAVSVAKAQYAGTERLVPAGQAEPVRQLLRSSAQNKATSQNTRMREIGAIREESSTKVTEHLQAGGHKSHSVSHRDAIELAKGNTRKISRMIAVDSVASAAATGFKSGALFSGCISAATSARSVAKGEVSAQDAIMGVATETIQGAIRSATTAVVSEGVKVVAKRTLSQATAGAVLRGAAPLAIAGCAVDVVSDAFKGELTIRSAATSMTRAAGGWAGAQGGAALGTLVLPGIGTAIGGLLGGVCGSLVGGAW